ncbi:MAG: transposase, partial [Peptostreptococcaceae bacterium]|nr:transposase [Peptostreptococcaceae bacterium]
MVFYLSVRQYLPVERITELLSSLCGLSLSTGGVCYLLEKVKLKALPVYETIRQIIANGKVIGANETGVNINGKNYWVWTFQNSIATYIAIHKSRGTKAIEQIMPEGFEDKSSRPHTIHYALNDFEKTLVSSIRQSTWLSLDEVPDMVIPTNPGITRSVVYRTFVHEGINKVPEKEKDKAKKFKEY